MCAGLLLFGTLGHAGARSDTARSRPLVERPGCSRTLDDTDQQDLGPTAGGLVQEVTVQVPQTAMVRVDGKGRILAAWTNTGCAPRPTDEIYLTRPDGSIVAAATTAVLAHHRWIGDFTTAGVYVLQDR